MILAVRKISEGRKYISADLAEKLASSLDENRQKAAHDKLSDREFQVLRLIGSGMTVGQIAEELSPFITYEKCDEEGIEPAVGKYLPRCDNGRTVNGFFREQIP